MVSQIQEESLKWGGGLRHCNQALALLYSYSALVRTVIPLVLSSDTAAKGSEGRRGAGGGGWDGAGKHYILSYFCCCCFFLENYPQYKRILR